MPNITSGRRTAAWHIDITADALSADTQVPCVYCREPIAANSFASWSSTGRLLSATCPSCSRRVTLTAATWQRWCISDAAMVSAVTTGGASAER